MERTMEDVFSFLESLKKDLRDTLDQIEIRLARLEKMDSIEHRVAVNQIDLSDIKEILERLEDQQQSDSSHIHKRLDLHLLKIAKAEEGLALLQNKKEKLS